VTDQVVTISIDGMEIRTTARSKVLSAALDNGIYIPNLCAIRGAREQFAGCRLCQVEIAGRRELVTACTEPVAEGMVVRTDTPPVKRVRRTALELILSNHPVNCSECDRNGRCALQDTAAKLKVSLRQKRFPKIPREYPIDNSHPEFNYNPNLCILCGKCVWACNEHGNGALNFAFKGMETMVTTFAGTPLKEVDCAGCTKCVAICPTGALLPKKKNQTRPQRTDS
jgi:bidirectional [NiFe] hydrogenase diaphorase subunit